MKKTLISIGLLLTSSSVFAETEYPSNPVLRPLTLTEGTVLVAGAVSVGEENDDSRGEVNIYAGYGLTDNVTLGLGGIHYRFLARDNNKTGLELSVAAGIRDYQESSIYGDAVAYGADLNGKYVFDENLAMTFSLGYLKWDEENLKNKDEYRYSIGLQKNIVKDWSASIGYTYRDLKDFSQSEAHEASAGVNYAYSKSTDIGMYVGYSSFDAKENGYKQGDNFDRTVGIYAAYRF